jgi:ABC-type transport system involved in multi-copper enzyme maturation permease subunit
MRARIILTLKQHRFETVAVTIVCVGLTLAALIEAYRLNSLNVPFSCLLSYHGDYVDPSQGPITAAQAHCNELAKSFFDTKGSLDMNLVQLLLLFAPLLAGIVVGAPLVAREIEQGTAPLSWALSGSRRRWLLGKVLAGVVLLAPLMLAVGLAANVLEGALSPGLNPYASFSNYLGRGVIDVFWALAAFAGTFALGTLLGRTMPAVVVALVVCFFARAAWDSGMTHFVLRSFAVQQVQQDQQNQQVGYVVYGPGGPAYADMNVYYKSFIDGKEVTDAQVNAWYNQNMVCTPIPTPTPSDSTSPADSSSSGASNSPGAAATPGYSTTMGNGGIACQGPVIDPSHMPQQILYVIPGSWYWQTVALESGLLLLGSLFCGAIAFVWVDRRRPY